MIFNSFSAAAASGSSSMPSGFQEFNYKSTVQTFTVPEGVEVISVTACGGGGCGGMGSSSSEYGYGSGCGGGGGAAVVGHKMKVTPGESVSITVGKGGTLWNGDGGTTTVSCTQETLTLNGGHTGSTNDTTKRPGQAGGNGGGKGGLGYIGKAISVYLSGSYSSSGSYSGHSAKLAEDGENGILGHGGYCLYNRSSQNSYYGAGGGGSLGPGGNGCREGSSETYYATPGIKGGGRRWRLQRYRLWQIRCWWRWLCKDKLGSLHGLRLNWGCC